MHVEQIALDRRIDGPDRHARPHAEDAVRPIEVLVLEIFTPVANSASAYGTTFTGPT